MSNMLQERIEELDSAILNIRGKTTDVIGFLSRDRLNDYSDKGIQCFFSKGIYESMDLNFNNIKDNALFIVNENGIEVNKFCYNLIIKDKVKFKGADKKQLTRVFRVRQCEFTGIYHYIDLEDNIFFDCKDELVTFFEKKFSQLLVF